MFRAFVVEHPSLFSIGVQRRLQSPGLWAQFHPAATDALDVLHGRVARLDERDLLGGRTVNEATLQFHALCEGLASLEIHSAYPPDQSHRLWTDGLTALVAGFAVPARPLA